MMNNMTLLIFGIILLIVVGPSYQTLYTCNTTAVCGCASNITLINRIVGGEAAGMTTWDWIVSLSISNNYLCGGSIISRSWIITAAHCVNNFLGSTITAYAGSNIRWSGSQTRKVSRVIVHSQYNASTFVNDIALLQLTSPFDMNDSNVSTICLPLVNSTVLASSEWPIVNTSVVAVGWGRLTESGSLPQKLQQVTLQTVDYRTSTCSDLIADKKVQLCASVPGGTKDTCQGDSGGPLMMYTKYNQWVLIGLTSNGIGCARPSYAGIYTRVAAFKDWIRSFTNESSWIVMDSYEAPSPTSTATVNSSHFVILMMLSIITYVITF